MNDMTKTSQPSSEGESFETRFGRRIELDREHFAFFERIVGGYKTPQSLKGFIDAVSTNASETAGSEEQLNKFRDRRRRMTLRGYSARYTVSQILPDLLSRTFVKPRFKRGLDIGCGFGVQPMVWRGTGMVDEAHGIDMLDRCSNMDSGSLRSAHAKTKLFRFIEPYIESLMRRPRGELSDLERALLEKVSTPRLLLWEKTGCLLPTDIYKRRMVREPKLDRFIEGDVFKLNEKYDLITSLSSLEWFKLGDIFPKVSDLLVEGGIFYMYVGAWWSGSTNTKIHGHFPYARQRLDAVDFERYVDTYLSEHKEEVMTAYRFYDPHHPSLADFIQAGLEVGLVPVIYRADIPPYKAHAKVGIGPLGYAIDDHARFGEALEDIRKFRPDIGAQDMLADLLHIVFIKVDRNSRLKPTDYRRILEETEFAYRPKSRIGQAIRDLGIKLLLR